MSEWNFIILAPLSAALFAIGGTLVKAVRRFLLPAVLMIVCVINGVTWWKWLLMGGLSMVAYCLPYGDSLGDKWWSWVLRFLVVCSYFVALLPVGFSWAVIVSPCILIAMFGLSRMGRLTWKVWELTAGFLIGITLAGLI